VQVEVAAAWRGEEERCPRIGWCPFERSKRNRLQRDGADAGLGLRAPESQRGGRVEERRGRRHGMMGLVTREIAEFGIAPVAADVQSKLRLPRQWLSVP